MIVKIKKGYPFPNKSAYDKSVLIERLNKDKEDEKKVITLYPNRDKTE